MHGKQVGLNVNSGGTIPETHKFFVLLPQLCSSFKIMSQPKLVQQISKTTSSGDTCGLSPPDRRAA